ncbi:MAG: FHA domain-containing protein [Lachnospiraceae bacterium]|nr:FHA domain-containing protein [Lachnospiraceae bacterium]
MLDARYFKDYKHNYMILRCGQEQAEKSYQYRLLTSGRIEGILHCSLRHVNGESYFYYNISSRATLEGLYRGRQMNAQQIRELFEQLYGIYCELGNCFMEESRLVLLPEYIYYDMSRKKYVGLYYPDYEKDKPYEALMDFLLEHLDGADEKLANCIYTVYERMEESGFSLQDALQLLTEDEEESEQGKVVAFPAAPVDSESKAAGPAFSPELMEEDGNFRYEEESAPSSEKKKSLFYPALSVISILGIAGIACIYGYYELSDQEIMTLFGCGGLLAVCLLVGIVGTVRGGVKEVNAKREREKAESFPEEESYFPSGQTTISLEQVLSRQMEMNPAVPMKNPAPQIPFHAQEENESYADTVFFDSARTVEYKLYALDKKNKKHIELNSFPYTVGKMAGCVDCVLADDSVSRIHARFEKVGDRIQMTDMNSTNGTYRNGLRMQPQETVEIEPGDEIRFGNVNYCFR